MIHDEHFIGPNIGPAQIGNKAEVDLCEIRHLQLLYLREKLPDLLLRNGRKLQQMRLERLQKLLEIICCF
ncbi:hypothetical protein D3C76_1811020 [compost metagenome]